MFVGMSWEAFRGPLRGSFEASWGPCWVSWGVLGASWGLHGSALGAPRTRLGAEGSKCTFGSPIEATSCSHPPVSEASWAVLGLSRAVLGPSWMPLGAILGAPSAVLQRPESEQARTPESFKNQRNSQDVCLLGGLLETSWAVLRPSWASWSDLSARLGALLDRLGGVLGPSWPFGGPTWARKKACEKPRVSLGSMRQAPADLRIWGLGS